MWHTSEILFLRRDRLDLGTDAFDVVLLDSDR